MFRFVSSSIMQPLLQVPCGEWGAGGRGLPFFVSRPPAHHPHFSRFPLSILSSPWSLRLIRGKTPKSTQNLCEGLGAYLWLRQRDARLYLSNRRGGGGGGGRPIALFRNGKWIAPLALSGDVESLHFRLCLPAHPSYCHPVQSFQLVLKFPEIL